MSVAEESAAQSQEQFGSAEAERNRRLVAAVAEQRHRPCRRVDGARRRHRRRRPRAQYEAGFRGGAAGLGCAFGDEPARSSQGGRHEARDESRRRLGPALRHALPGARQGAAARNPRAPEAAIAFAAAIAPSRARGKSDAGQKTMLDVLIPVAEAFAAGGDAAVLRKTAARAAEATTPMRATRGRASFLGERSIGHVDPGARSSSLMIATLCDEFGES